MKYFRIEESDTDINTDHIVSVGPIDVLDKGPMLVFKIKMVNGDEFSVSDVDVRNIYKTRLTVMGYPANHPVYSAPFILMTMNRNDVVIFNVRNASEEINGVHSMGSLLDIYAKWFQEDNFKYLLPIHRAQLCDSAVRILHGDVYRTVLTEYPKTANTFYSGQADGILALALANEMLNSVGIVDGKLDKDPTTDEELEKRLKHCLQETQQIIREYHDKEYKIPGLPHF